ncbi:MAG TPA: penicillin acylase family protein [Geminicoccaceae bacterium]|nr:penicillin acylase family protein [Geminicoccus sp.]HMU49151.1 penicillin acylase family protein [Geminicoccaceae bacterium]
MRRILGRLLLAAAGLIVAALAAGAFLAWGSLPQRAGRIAVPGPEAEVEIRRDAWGIPRIRAQSPADAYFGLGFAHAQDRLWQMEMNRRIAQGRLAEIAGEAALPVDRFMRLLGLYRHAEASAAHLPAEARRLLGAYAAGVNAFLATRRWPLPPEFQLLWHTPEPWRIEDSLVFTRLMALDLGGNWRAELLRARLAQWLTAEQLADLFPDQPADTPVTIAALRRTLAGLDLDGLAAALPSEPPPGLGSNVWVVDGSRTASGRPLLANDPHLGLQVPGIWYLAGLEAPGLSVIGGTMPSMPIVVSGRNADLAWGLTNTGPDTQDLFVERIDPADSGRYLTPEGSAAFAVREEAIGVRGGGSERLVVRETRHGPVISDLVPPAAALAGEGKVLALAWTALADDDVTLLAGLGLATAADGEWLDEALRPFASPQQNVTWATRDGRIGLVAPGRVPIRRGGDGRLPVPGWDGAADWIGTIPFEALPRTVDPPSGQIVNANNRLVGPDYPYLVTADWDPALRARRIEAMLAGQGGLDLQRFAAMQADIRSTLADDFLPFLLAAAPEDTAPELIEALAGWDRLMSADRPEPLAFAAWYDALAVAIYADELGPLFEAYRGLRPDFTRLALTGRQIWCDDVATPEIESCGQRVALAWRMAVAEMRKQWGEDWRARRWGEAHRIVMRHRLMESLPLLGRLFGIDLPGSGDGSTVNVAHYPGGGGPRAFHGSTGPSYRMLVDLADPESSLFVAAGGQSGHPLSEHWKDLTELWAVGSYVPMRRTVEAMAGRVLILTPRPPD